MTTVGPVPPPLPQTAPAQPTTTSTAAASAGATPAPSTPVITENAVHALTAIIVNLPNTLKAKPEGTLVSGTLVGQDAAGLQLLRTAEGTVVLRGLNGVPVGTQLALTLPDIAGGVSTARLALLRAADGLKAGQLGSPAIQTTPLTPGQIFTATLVQQAGLTRVGGNYAQAPIGANFDVRLLAIGNPVQAAATAAGNPVITATVVGHTANGLLVVNAGFGLLTLPAEGQVAAGQTLQLELLGRQLPATDAARAGSSPLPSATAAPPADALTLARDWETLRQAFETLRSADPQLAQTMIGRAAAQPGEGFAPSLLFMVVALRGGNLGTLLGEPAMRALERAGRGNLLRRLSDEFSTLQRLASEPAADWRAFFLPVQHPDGALTPVRMFFRRPRDGKSEQQAATRFVVETELTRMGPLQIDGLARPTRVDMILRTRQSLTDQAKTDIEQIFHAATETGGFTGTLAFQTIDRFPIDPLDEIGAHAKGVTA